MPAATSTEEGRVVIPAEIRARYRLTPGTQVEFVDEGGTIRRRVALSDPAEGCGLIQVAPSPEGQSPRRLSQFDPAALLKCQQSKP